MNRMSVPSWAARAVISEHKSESISAMTGGPQWNTPTRPVLWSYYEHGAVIDIWIKVSPSLVFHVIVEVVEDDAEVWSTKVGR